jgi:hypothetical protein
MNLAIRRVTEIKDLRYKNPEKTTQEHDNYANKNRIFEYYRDRVKIFVELH